MTNGSYVALIAQVVTMATLFGCDASFSDLRPPQPADSLVARGPDTLPRNRDAGPLQSDGAAADARDGSASSPDQATSVSGPYARGTFTGRGGYSGSGIAELVRNGDTIELRFNDQFSVSAVPGPVVVLSTREAIGPGLDTAAGDLELGVLKDVSGAQTYALSSATDGDRRYAWVYCKPFGVEVARATLEAIR